MYKGKIKSAIEYANHDDTSGILLLSLSFFTDWVSNIYRV